MGNSKNEMGNCPFAPPPLVAPLIETLENVRLLRI